MITGYRQFLEEDKESKSLGRIENLDELVSAAIDYESSTGDNSMLGFLDQATLVADADEVDNKTGAVKLMTVHVSKGLEFPVVFVAGLEDKLFPHARSIDDPAMVAEERRLLYVAMTRAKERLYLSNAVNRRIFGVTTPCKPSQFLFDIPEDILETRKSAGLTSQKSVYAGQSRKSFAPAKPAKIFGKKKQVSTSKTSDGIGVGDKVSHSRFGAGIVRDISGQGEKSKVTVYFTRYGEKKLIWKFAKLSKV